MIEKELVGYLLADAGLALMIGDRLHDMVLPQSPTLPAVVWQRISTTRVHSQSGASRLARPRFQFTCWATTTLAAIQVAGALREALDGYGGRMGMVENVAIFGEGENAGLDPETGLRNVALDFFIWHSE